MRVRGPGLVLFLFLAVACGSPPPPPPPPSASPTTEPGLRPLTSRDGGTQAPAIPEAPGLPPGHPPVGGETDPAAPAKHGRPVAGTIAIAPALSSRLAATDVLYLIARNQKTKAVVAVRRDEGVAFPHAFEIGPEDVMVKGQSFQGPFDLVARVSRSGDALPAAGDLEGLANDVAEGARGVSLVIDRVRQ